MKLTYFASSTVLVEAGNCKILMDPWLVDGEYYGSWAHAPKLELDFSIFDDVDFIYISHIHPDHLSAKTMALLRKDIPVLIHAYNGKFLKHNIEAAGFEVRELAHNLTTDIGRNTQITILAADDCDPGICGSYFNCAPLYGSSGSTQIDSLCVIQHGDQVIVNTNDCPFDLVKQMLPRIHNEFGHIDMLLTGYSGAGPYPQCFSNLNYQQKVTAAAKKKHQFLEHGMAFINALQPRLVLPFAGQYTLAGRLSKLNDLRGVAKLTEAADHFSSRLKGTSKIILLNRGGSVEIPTGITSGDFEPQADVEREEYCRSVLIDRTFDFDADAEPSEVELIDLARESATRLERKRIEMKISTETDVFVKLSERCFAKVSLNGKEMQLTDRLPTDSRTYVMLSVEPKLLKRILSGPRFAHWNNATIGSHVEFHRQPDSFERSVYEVMNYFHA